MAEAAPIRAIVCPLDLAQHLFEVELTFPAEAVARGAVAALPAWTPGSYLVRDYARFVDRVRVLEGRREHPLGKLDKQRWQLPAAKKELRLRYRVYGNDLMKNGAHASDSPESAERERRIVGLWEERGVSDTQETIDKYLAKVSAAK